MADKKISALTPLSELTGDERIPVAKDGKNYSVTPNKITEAIKAKLDSLDKLTKTLNEGIGALDNDVYGILFRVVSEALCQLRAEISSLREALANLGNANAVSYDCDMGYLVCGQKTFDVVEGAPTEIPRSVGLFRFDKTTKTLYVSDELTNLTKDWKMIS